MRRIFPIVLILLIALPAMAATQVSRYVTTTCANNGDGTAASCAASNGATGAYNSLNNARSDIFTDYADFTSSDVNVTVYVSGSTADTTSVSFTSCPTMDATRRLTILGSGADKAGTLWSTSKYRLAASITTLTAGCAYLILDGFQIQAGNVDDHGLIAISVTTGSPLTIRNMLIRKNPSTGSFGNNSRGIYVQVDRSGTDYIYNNIIYDFDTDSGNQCVETANYSSGNMYFYNNTLIGCTTGISDGYSDIVAKNNVVQSATTCYNGSFNASSTYNLAECASAPGSNSSTSATVSFVDEGGKDFALASGDTAAKNTGTDLSGDGSIAFSTDILGNTRTGTWDRGAHEFQSTGSAVIPILQNRRRSS